MTAVPLWGACPQCGANDGALRLPLEWPDDVDEWPDGTVSEWFFCREHRKKWRLFVITSFTDLPSAFAAEINAVNDAAAAESIGLEDFEDVTDELPEDPDVIDESE